MITPVWKEKEGRWRIQARKDGKVHSFSSSIPGPKGRKEVLRKYENWYYGEASGEKTVKRVSEEYLEDVKARRGENSAAYELYERYIRLYITPKLGTKKICKVTLRDWQRLINEASGQNKPLSEKTLINLRGIIMGIIHFGYEDYQCELPRGNLYIPCGHWKKEKEVLEKDQIKRLLEPSELWYYPVFVFGLMTGMRPGEILGLKITDLDDDCVYIRRSVNSRGFITEGKNENARRMIPIGSYTRSILLKTIKRNQDKNLRTEWIFCSRDGSMGNQSTMSNQWIQLKKERQLSGTVYSLRHTFISMMKNVMPETMIKDIVGHSVSMQTFHTYGHIMKSDKASAAKIIDLTFGSGDIFGDTESTTGEQK